MSSTAPPPSPSLPVPTEAIVSLTLGIISIVSVLLAVLTGFSLVGGVCAPFAVWLGRRAQNLIRRHPDRYSGEGLALAAFVTGIVGCVLFVLGLLAVLFIVLFFVWMFSELSTSAGPLSIGLGG